jgi:type IIS restriction enzyme R and M protein
MNAVVKKIETILKSPYDTKNYVDLVREIFPKVSMVSPDKFRKEFTNFSSHIEGSIHVGNYKTPDKKNIIIMAVQLKNAGYVENSRSTQRSYAKKLIENANADAAFIAFYTEGEQKWRLSFVRFDYEMKIENGRLKTTENLTPAKRYSYLVGKNEPCHTAISRFERFIIDSMADPEHPTLDDLENAFSVEKVTDEFFKLYCEKFHQLREKLEENEDFRIEAQQHNFTSAQFAKKLMGQIVFLYFLQKKGWLGVGAWPNTLTEKEYKNAYYARGAKSRELIPMVYRPVGDGTYRISGAGLNSISDEDEAVLAMCVKGKPWGSGPHNFMRKLFEIAEKKNQNFFDELLEPLFYDALNVNRGEQGYCPALHCRIPFLSGGLFEPIDGYDWEHNNFNIPNEVFSNAATKGREADGILDIFDRYNFTMSEDEPMEREVAIDPEMLGKVFENLLEVNDRKSKGAFYTPREIVHYMCQESLINYLTNTLQIEEEAIREFILYGDFMKGEDTVKEKRQGNGGMYISEILFKLDADGKVVVDRLQDVDEALKNVRVADPAVGSGAFPLGMLNEIVRARQNISAYMAITMNAYDTRLMYQMERSPHNLKYETIKNCIFAADIEPSAVDIAHLRLWLSLVIDDEINPNAQSALDGHKNPLPLPNLESNILCGNSLIDEFEGTRLIKESELFGDSTYHLDMNHSRFESIVKTLIDKQNELFHCDNTEKKKQLKDEIESLRDMVIMSQLEGCGSDKVQRYHESKRTASKPYVLWQLDFARVFREKGGFDIVIGNPPYVDSEEMTRSMPEQREIYTKKYSCAKGNWDLFVLFIEKGMDLLAENKTISYIVPNKLISAPYTEALRKKMAKNRVIEIRDYSNVNVFKEAAVYPVVFRVEISNNRTPVKMDVMEGMEIVGSQNTILPEKFYADINWDKYFNTSAEALSIVDKMAKFLILSSIADVNGAATVGEAYLVKEFMYDNDGEDDSVMRFINTGGIDKYKSFYGIEYIRYLKGKYMYPVVKTADLKNMSVKRFNESQSEKIIIGGMNKVLECFYDDGNYLAGKSTTIVYNNPYLKVITAILNSTLMSFYYATFYNSMSLAGGFYRIGAPQIKALPIALPDDVVTIETLENLVDEAQELLKSLQESDREVQNVLKQIDNIVYKLYGLTNDEISCVEN